MRNSRQVLVKVVLFQLRGRHTHYLSWFLKLYILNEVSFVTTFEKMVKIKKTSFPKSEGAYNFFHDCTHIALLLNKFDIIFQWKIIENFPFLFTNSNIRNASVISFFKIHLVNSLNSNSKSSKQIFIFFK